MNPSPLRWGILGAGRIARTFAAGLAATSSGRLIAIGSRTRESAEAFVRDTHPSVRAHASYEALLGDPEVDAVYIATPHPQHAEGAIRAAEAGKHILCEKPAAVNRAEAMVMIEAAREQGVFLMEAYMYRCHPQTEKLAELVRSGAIGQLRVIQGAFGFQAAFDPSRRLFSNTLAGGGILDVGGYPVSMARRLAGAAAGRGFLDPIEVKGAAHLFPETGVDAYAAAVLKFSNAVVAQVSCGVAAAQDNALRLYGSEGWIHVPAPWVPARDGGAVAFTLHRPGRPPEEIAVESPAPLYALEAEVVARAVAAGRREAEEMSWEDTLGNLAALDAWRASAGLLYEGEKSEAAVPTVSRRPLRRRATVAMRTGEVPGLAKPVSRLVMGCDNQTTLPHASALFDDFFERGGNAFDTAYHYAQGLQEKLLGRWIENRGVRADVAVIVKGAHTPLCTPEFLRKQLAESLERLRIDHADLYLMHRDNLDVPVGEFVDALNEEAGAGRIKVFGGSNWTLERVRAANRYARRKGLRGFQLLSNNFSLARMVEPPWKGCLSAGDEATRAWLKKTQTALLAWSSQARGFFTERAHPDRRDDPELVRCWYAEDNWRRRERALELAREKGVSPIALALAYVLHQPFPTYALIGPRQISETISSLTAWEVELTPKEVAWLNLERERRG